MPTQRLTTEILTAAIEGFEAQKKRIDEQISELRSFIANGSPVPSAKSESLPRKRAGFSEATKLKMKEAQQRRWAKIKGEAEPAAAAPVATPVKAKRQLSAAGRAAIAEAARKRWAAQKATQETAEPAAAKKATRKKTAGKKPGRKKSAE